MVLLKTEGERDLLAKLAVMTWETPSKKKNFETIKVLNSMHMLAATTASRQTILQTRMMLRTM